MNKYIEIWENYQNGNKSDAKKLMKKIKKSEIVTMMHYLNTMLDVDYTQSLPVIEKLCQD